MKKRNILMPEGIYHLSDYGEQIESQFPQGSFILDKSITGCGATTLFLSDPFPTILCSSRKELMFCKANDPQFIGKVYLFRENDDYKTPVIDLENRMMQYINNCNNPFQQSVPKILVTYDSFKHVAQRLCEGGILGKFRVIVDEAQTLFTDAAFKGDVEIEFLSNLSNASNIIYLSATPYIEAYLDQLDEFKNLPYLKLIWPESSLHDTNITKEPYYKGKLSETVSRIIDNYREHGFFANKILMGKEVYSTEAVFYLNDVQQIINIIKKNGLTADETNIICSENERNAKRLEKIGHNIGHAPQKGKPHKTFTFVTKCSFEGTDFYSPCAITYIFADANLKNLALDISLDIPQIMGRQRLNSNPFRYDAVLYYKDILNFSESSYQDYMLEVSEMSKVTNEWIETFEKSSSLLQTNMVSKLRSSQNNGEHNDYVAVVDNVANGKPGVVFNRLAQLNDIRAWEIQKSQYYNGCQVMKSVDDVSRPITSDPIIQIFLSNMVGDFRNCIKTYCEFLFAYPKYKSLVESLPQIPLSIKQYYNTLGPEEIRAQSYIESNIRRRIDELGMTAQVREAAKQEFISNKFYSLQEVKSKLQAIYDRLGIIRTAKATDLDGLIEYAPKKMTVGDKRENGYLIL